MLTEENMISISFEYKDSLKVAEIVNYITTELKRKADALFEQRASKNKEFIEDRYFDNLRKIDSLQIEMEMLQNKYGVFELIEQTKSILASIADLEAQIIVKRAELEH
ncbi:MAG: hypothetical protein U5K00_12550 [Melioribacteraceae bacterium]|nr:hypothetical protein [Melioribacteraceae bacterium]